MPVKIHSATGFVSNKPKAPEPTPSEADFPTLLEMPGGEVVWVSQPQPDRLTLVGELGEQTFSAKVPAGLGHAEFLKAFGTFLLGGPHNAHYVESWWSPQKGYHRRVTLALGPRGSNVRFEPQKSLNGWRLRIEMNPRKLGKQGLAQLKKILGSPSSGLNSQAFLDGCRVTRLDVALDFVGVAVEQAMLRHKNEGKRSFYVGTDGALETVMVHRKLPPTTVKYDPGGNPKKVTHRAQPAGKVLLKAYDRVKERAAVLQPPPFGPAPVTRVEVVLGPQGPLGKLHELKSPFKAATLAFAQAQPAAANPLWLQYFALRRIADATTAKKLLGLSVATAEDLEAALIQPTSFLDTDELWKGWAGALSSLGLTTFTAETK